MSLQKGASKGWFLRLRNNNELEEQGALHRMQILRIAGLKIFTNLRSQGHLVCICHRVFFTEEGPGAICCKTIIKKHKAGGLGLVHTNTAHQPACFTLILSSCHPLCSASTRLEVYTSQVLSLTQSKDEQVKGSSSEAPAIPVETSKTRKGTVLWGKGRRNPGHRHR